MRMKDKVDPPLCCSQVTAPSTSGFMCPWAGGRIDAIVTMDTDTGRGPRKGTPRPTMDENPLRTVSVQDGL